jgi:hypothetical protein
LFFGELVKYWVVLSDEAAAHWGISFDKDKALSPEQIKAFIIAIFLSSLAILFTPYGVGMLEEVWRTMSDPHAKLIIGEWRATDLTSLSGLLFFLSSALLMAIGLASRNKIDATHALFLIAFFVIGLTAVRLTYFFLLIMFWVFLPKIPKSAFTSFSMTPLAKQPLMSVLMVVVIGAGFADIGIGIANRSSSLSEPALLAADSWLKKPNIKVFAETCWGGFLLYQYPKMKLFVDGRMNHWEYDSDRTFLKFSQDLMALQGDWKETLESLDPECIVISTPRPLASVLSELSAKWILVHKDDATSVFCKPK